MQHVQASRPRGYRNARLCNDNRLDVCDIADCDNRVDRFGVKRQIDRPDDRSVAAGQDAFDGDRVSTLIEDDAAGAGFIVNAGQRSTAVYKNINGRRIERRMQNLNISGWQRRHTNERRNGIAGITGGETECGKRQ